MENAPLAFAKRGFRHSVGTGFGLFPEDFLDVADFVLDFAADFFGSAFVLQVRVIRGLAGFFFYSAFHLVCGAFGFISYA